MRPPNPTPPTRKALHLAAQLVPVRSHHLQLAQRIFGRRLRVAGRRLRLGDRRIELLRKLGGAELGGSACSSLCLALAARRRQLLTAPLVLLLQGGELLSARLVLRSLLLQLLPQLFSRCLLLLVLAPQHNGLLLSCRKLAGGLICLHLCCCTLLLGRKSGSLGALQLCGCSRGSRFGSGACRCRRRGALLGGGSSLLGGGSLASHAVVIGGSCLHRRLASKELIGLLLRLHQHSRGARAGLLTEEAHACRQWRRQLHAACNMPAMHPRAACWAAPPPHLSLRLLRRLRRRLRCVPLRQGIRAVLLCQPAQPVRFLRHHQQHTHRRGR